MWRYWGGIWWGPTGDIIRLSIRGVQSCCKKIIIMLLPQKATVSKPESHFLVSPVLSFEVCSQVCKNWVSIVPVWLEVMSWIILLSTLHKQVLIKTVNIIDCYIISQNVIILRGAFNFIRVCLILITRQYGIWLNGLHVENLQGWIITSFRMLST